MHQWLLLTLCAIVSRAIYSVAGKVMSHKMKASAQTLALTMVVTASVISLVVSPLIGNLSFKGIESVWPQIVLLILAGSLGNILYFEGLTRLDASVVQIAFSSILAWGVGLSVVVLDSHFSFVQLAGVMLLACAIGLAQYNPHRETHKAVFLILASAGLFAVWQVLSADVSHAVTPGTYLVVSYVGQALVIGGVYHRRVSRELRGQLAPTLAASWLTGVTTVAYYLAAYFAFRAAPDAGVVILLLTSHVVLSVLLSAIFLREREHMGRKTIAAVIAVAAAVLIKT